MGGTPTNQPFAIETFPPAVDLATHNVQPPGNLLVTTNDQLVYQIITSSASYSVSFFARLLLPDGTIKQFQKDITGNGLRTTAQAVQQLADGFLLSVTVISSGANAPRGGAFARVIIYRAFQAPATAQIWNQVLIAAYTSLYDVPTWPPVTYESSRSGQGNIRSITGATPAAGAEISETVPNGAIWRVMSFRYSLTTSATVANRGSALVVDDGTNALVQLPPPSTIAQSASGAFNWAPTLEFTTTSGQLVSPIPQQLLIGAGYRLRTSTGGLQVGDQYTAPQYLVEEWLGL